MMSDMNNVNEDNITDEYIFNFVVKLFAQNMPKNLMERIERDLNCVNTIDKKITKLSQELKEFGGKGLVYKDLDQILRDSFLRAKMMIDYRLKMNNKGKFKVIRDRVGKKVLNKLGKMLIIKPLEDLNDIDMSVKNDIKSQINILTKHYDQVIVIHYNIPVK